MRKKIKLRVDGDIITAVLFFPDKTKQHKAVIFFNGSGGVKERFFTIAEFLALKGLISFCFDFRGRGESPTKQIPPLGFQIKDAQKAIQYVSSLPFAQKNDVTLVATSMGGYIASSAVNIHPGIKKLILIAPSIHLLDDEDRKYTEVGVAGFRKEYIPQARSIKEIGKFKGEFFVVFLGEDKTIPNWMAQAYLDSALLVKKKTKLEIKDSEHAIFRTESGREKVKKLLEKILI